MEKAELILKAEQQNVDAAMLKGSVLLARKKVKAVISMFEKLIAGGEKRADIYLMLLSTAYILSCKTDSG